MVKIWLDAGHGGKDGGAGNGSRNESDDVLKFVLAVGKKLTDYYENVEVGYSRNKDTYDSPSQKAAKANSWQANYFFSFHRNSASSRSAKGYETLVYYNSGKRKEVAAAFNDAMEKAGFRNRGTKVRTDLAVLRRTNMPAWLLEIGFISNNSDNKLFDNKFDDLVDAVVDVIAKFTKLEEKVTVKKRDDFKIGAYNQTVEITKKCPVRSGRGKVYKKLGTLKAGDKVEVLYILKNRAGNLWGSIDYKDSIGYIYLGNCKPA